MAIIFMDGFDHYVTADIEKKWDINTNGKINTSIKRNGAGSIGLNTVYNDAMAKKLITSTNVLVAGFAFYGNNIVQNNNDILVFYDNDIAQIILRVNPDNTLSVYRNTILLSTTEMPYHIPFQWDYYEMKVVFSSTSGSVEVRRNEATILSLDNITTIATANEYANGFGFRPRCKSPSSSNILVYYDDVYVDDLEFRGDVKIETIYADASGANTEWNPSIGNNYACVDEVPQNNDTDYVYASIAGVIDTYTYQDLVSFGQVCSVQINLMARMDDSGFNKVAPVVRPSNTNIIGDTKELNQNYKYYSQVFNINPETSQPWTIEDINNCEFGIKLIE